MTSIGAPPMEALLREVAAELAWPPTPDLRAAVLSRIELPSAPVRRPARRPIATLARVLALAAALVLVIAGVAAAIGYRLPGFDLVFTEPVPSAGAGLDLGASLPMGDALAVERPRVVAPAAVRPPDAAWVLGSGDERIVTLAWRAAAGEAALAGSDLVLTVMAVPGDTEEGMIRKSAGPGTTIEAVTVNGDRGWWITGAPHEIVILGTAGSARVLRSAIVGDTLLFARDGTLYRLESALGRDVTLEIARSMP